MKFHANQTIVLCAIIGERQVRLHINRQRKLQFWDRVATAVGLTFPGSLVACSWGMRKIRKLPLMSETLIIFCIGPSLLGCIPNSIRSNKQIPTGSLWFRQSQQSFNTSLPLFLFSFTHYMFRPLRAIFRWGIQSIRQIVYVQHIRCSKKKINSIVWVHERTIPTKWPPLVGKVIANFCG
jgi:hypothetical protein